MGEMQRHKKELDRQAQVDTGFLMKHGKHISHGVWVGVAVAVKEAEGTTTNHGTLIFLPGVYLAEVT